MDSEQQWAAITDVYRGIFRSCWAQKSWNYTHLCQKFLLVAWWGRKRSGILFLMLTLSRQWQSCDPRPLGEALHGTSCNEVLHFDFISMHPLSSKSNHTLQMYWSLKTICPDLLNWFLPVHPIILSWVMRYWLAQKICSYTTSSQRPSKPFSGPSLERI